MGKNRANRKNIKKIKTKVQSNIKNSAFSPQNIQIVDSLLDAMEEGNEYASIVSLMPNTKSLNLELRRALKEIEDIRKKPCLCYLANVINTSLFSSIMDNDDLPFNEMISKVDESIEDIDLMIVTNGGSAQQVAQFVDALRSRFNNIEYILPYKCMSAGTLWVLSGDKIWMDERAFIGPVDPQERMPDGSFIPAQALLGLIEKFKKEWENLRNQGKNPPIAEVRILDKIDARRIGNAKIATDYVENMAIDFLFKYKFKSWLIHNSNGKAVNEQEKKDRATEISTLLASNERWKSHAHGLSREVVEKELKLKIDRLESFEGLERAVRRMWALIYWIFDRSKTAKVIFSQDYILIRNNPPTQDVL